MAIRIDQCIVRGWIDNTTPGITRGGLELVGMDQPVIITLRGNCWRDLAGTRLDFSNPEPKAQPEVIENLHHRQRGVVGDMTASQKIRVPLITESEFEEYFEKNKEIPSVWRNSIHLEWFSLVNGRVMIETDTLDLKLSTHQWELDEEGERLQKMENALAMEHFMELMLTASEAESKTQELPEENADEFAWEKRLRVRDSLEEAAWFLHEGPTEISIKPEAIDDESVSDRHPLVKKAYQIQLEAMDALGDAVIKEGQRGELAMALGFIYDSFDEAWPEKELPMENGYRVAMLKRSLEACNCAIAACNTLAMEENRFEDLRQQVFTLRDNIIDTCHTLREGYDA